MITDGLNKAQFEAVTSEHKRILCLAGAGTGKTKTLTSRIALLNENRVSCNSMLALTFTRLAGKEMKERVIKLIGKSEGSKLFCNTFHAFCVKVLRQYGSRLGYDADFSIYDQDDCASIIQTIIEDYRYNTTLKKVQVMLALVLDVDKALKDGIVSEQEELKVIKDYQYHLKRNNAFDFDGLMNNVSLLLESNQDIRLELQKQYSHVFVDEFQDTNNIQWSILALIDPENLFVVGDDFQSIYGWRGANIDLILMLSTHPRWQTIKLEQNYRSTQPIVEAANRLIKHNVSQTEKVLISVLEGELPVIDVLENEQQEARIITAAALSQVVDGNYADMAVLARTNKQLQKIKDTFDTFNIPAEVINNAEDIFKKTDIRSLFAYLELLVNPKDDHAFKKAINFPVTRLTSAELARLQLIAIDCECSLYESLPKFEGPTSDFTTGINLLSIEGGDAAVIFDTLVDYLDLITTYGEQGRRYSKGTDIAQALLKLGNWCETQKSLGEDCSISAFLKWLHIRDIQDKLLDKQNRVKLMTVHAAKGLEFESVFIAGMNQGCFPSRRGDLEEERRLFYVAVTRAKRNLYICRTKNVDAGHGGGYMSMPSQFLGEMQAV